MKSGTQSASIGRKSNRGIFISAAAWQSYFDRRSFIFLNFISLVFSYLPSVCGLLIPLSFQEQHYYPQKTKGGKNE
jgi:hypothetical protein